MSTWNVNDGYVASLWRTSVYMYWQVLGSWTGPVATPTTTVHGHMNITTRTHEHCYVISYKDLWNSHVHTPKRTVKMGVNPVTGLHEPLRAPWHNHRACGQQGRQLDTQEMNKCNVSRQRERNHTVPSYSDCDERLAYTGIHQQLNERRCLRWENVAKGAGISSLISLLNAAKCTVAVMNDHLPKT